jgi:hypothetical protein
VSLGVRIATRAVHDRREERHGIRLGAVASEWFNRLDLPSALRMMLPARAKGVTNDRPSGAASAREIVDARAY